MDTSCYMFDVGVAQWCRDLVTGASRLLFGTSSDGKRTGLEGGPSPIHRGADVDMLKGDGDDEASFQ